MTDSALNLKATHAALNLEPSRKLEYRPFILNWITF